jgi:epoxyqueuosine reductase
MNNEICDFKHLVDDIKSWGTQWGFTLIGITNIVRAIRESPQWDLPPYPFDAKSVICCAINYLPNCDKSRHISRYALGRDYHKVIRKRLRKLVRKINDKIGNFNYRCHVDSNRIPEKYLAAKAGLGWQGKNSLIINRHYGSWMFLGEIVTDLPLPIDEPHANHCGKCTACMNACPTQAIVAPNKIDVKRCISYLTIEHRSSIPEDLRPLIGNHIYGCDECQLVCPWNRFAKLTTEQDFQPRHNLNSADLIELFSWSEQNFLRNTEGSAIRRIGYECWLRNIAVALGNAHKDSMIIGALKMRQNHSSVLVREHVRWAFHNKPKKFDLK